LFLEAIISIVHGYTQGLKHNQLRRIEKLASRRVSSRQIISPELARQMTEISHETGRQIGVLINRKGQVEYVMVGDAKQIFMPDFKRVRVGSDRFRGLRCIHTHLAGEKLTRDDLTDLALLRLDLMAAIDVDGNTGLPNLVHSAHLLPATAEKLGADPASLPYEFLTPQIPAHLDIDFPALIDSLENEMARNRGTARNRQTARERVILVGVSLSAISEAEESMSELEELAASADVIVLDKIIQRRKSLDPKTVIGRGKLSDLLVRAMQLGADLIVFDCELTPAQIREISEATDLKVIDRPQLILDIFAQRAQSREGKIQVELAQLKYMLPRLIAGHDSAFSRLAGGIGGRGPGETKLETDRRRVRDKIARLEGSIEHLRRQRTNRRKERDRRGVPIISLVGYTNAGKSTLLNTLTQSHVHAEKRMFATLDPTSRRLRLPYEQEVVINDTVGFIRDLPPTLVAAFRATLEEISDSDLLLHIVDASNPRCLAQIAAVEKILADLEFDKLPRLTVLNKIDLLSPPEAAALRHRIGVETGAECVVISALKRESLAILLEKTGNMLLRNFSERLQFSDAVAY
jgi:GTP-binding protein HflX